MSDWKIIELNPPDENGKRKWTMEIPFVWESEKYGRAEFHVCPVWKRGKIQELWISPHQQPSEQGKMYHIVCGYSDGIHSQQDADIWRVNWCKLHKTSGFDIYVPDYSTKMLITLVSSIGLMFSK